MYQRPSLERLSGVERLFQCIQNQVGFGRVGHPPTDDPSSAYSDHESHLGQSLPGRHVRVIRHPPGIGSVCRELALHEIQGPVRVFVGDRRPDAFATDDAVQAHGFHQALNAALGHRHALALQLSPNLANALHMAVRSKDPADIGTERFVPLGPVRAPFRVRLLSRVGVRAGWGDWPHPANRLAPIRLPVLINKGFHVFMRRSSSAWAT